MQTYLDAILEAHRSRAADDLRPLDELLEVARSAPPGRPFADALRAGPGVSLIAEIKRRSPSRGLLAPGLDPSAVARAYESGGSACLSVLTDSEFFGGSEEDLRRARDSVRLPVLRKDFTVCPADVCDARIMGADAVLVIAAALPGTALEEVLGVAREVGIEALVEVHDEGELARAATAGATLVGVNQRDLFTFEVDRTAALRLAPSIPPGAVSVAESGVGSPSELGPLAEAGFDGVLVGESLVRATDPEQAARAFATAGAGRRGAAAGGRTG